MERYQGFDMQKVIKITFIVIFLTIAESSFANSGIQCLKLFSDEARLSGVNRSSALSRAYDKVSTDKLRELSQKMYAPLNLKEEMELVKEAKILLKQYADPDVKVEVFIPIGYTEVMTPLWIATKKEHANLVALFLDYGAATELRIDKKYGPFQSGLTGRDYYLSDYQTAELINYSKDPNFAMPVRLEFFKFNHNLRRVVFYPQGFPGTYFSRAEASRNLAKINIPLPWQQRNLSQLYAEIESLLKLGADPNYSLLGYDGDERGPGSLAGRAITKKADDIALLLVKYGANTVVANHVSGINLVEYAENSEGNYELARKIEVERRKLIDKYLQIKEDRNF